MHVLLTRPYLQSIDMTRQLEDMGCVISIEPILEIIPIRYQRHIFKYTKAFVVTSKHASSQIANSQDIDKKTSIYAIGPATAECLQNAGFTNLLIADGDAKSLLKLIQEKQKPEDGLITYFSGWHITQDLAHFLAMNGYDAQRVVCYKALQTQKLSPLTQEMIKRKEIDCMFFMSGRTADRFCQLCETNDLAKSLKSIIAISMSKHITDIISRLKWKDIKTASHPSVESLLNTLSDVKRSDGLLKLGKVRFQPHRNKIIS